MRTIRPLIVPIAHERAVQAARNKARKYDGYLPLVSANGGQGETGSYLKQSRARGRSEEFRSFSAKCTINYAARMHIRDRGIAGITLPRGRIDSDSLEASEREKRVCHRGK